MTQIREERLLLNVHLHVGRGKFHVEPEKTARLRPQVGLELSRHRRLCANGERLKVLLTPITHT